MQRRRGARVLGPYEQHNGWRVVEISAAGEGTSSLHKDEPSATRYMDMVNAELDRVEHTTETAFAEYKLHLAEKGDKPESIEVTEWAVNLMFTSAVPLSMLSGKRCATLYGEMRTRPSKRTGKPLANDTHRNALAQTKSFLEWCVKRGWLRENPAAKVEGTASAGRAASRSARAATSCAFVTLELSTRKHLISQMVVMKVQSRRWLHCF